MQKLREKNVEDAATRCLKPLQDAAASELVDRIKIQLEVQKLAQDLEQKVVELL